MSEFSHNIDYYGFSSGAVFVVVIYYSLNYKYTVKCGTRTEFFFCISSYNYDNNFAPYKSVLMKFIVLATLIYWRL